MNKPKPEEVCEEIMEILLKDGFSYQVCKKDIEKAIFRVRGIDKRTTERWLKVLLTFDYLQEINKVVYRMNVAKIPHLFQILKHTPQTRLSSSAHTHTNLNLKKKEP